MPLACFSSSISLTCSSSIGLSCAGSSYVGWSSPGTEHIAMPIPYLHHFKEFLMGTIGLVIVGLAIAAVLSIRF